MQIQLNYGRTGLDIDLPEQANVTVIRKPDMPVLPDPEASITAALQNPVGCEALEEMAAKAQSACIAICDITRPVPNGLFLRPMIESLIAGGIRRDRIQVLVATGLHRPNEGDELAELIGDPWVLDNVAVDNHFARDDGQHVLLGRTSKRDTVVRLDKRFVEADIKIATGLVEPHFMAGYSGGRKVIAPGLAHAETITTFHSARFMADPAAANCNFLNNPLHEEQLEIMQLLGGALALNTVIDENRALSFVNFGEILASHAEAVDYVREYCEVEVPRRFSTVVTSAAGYPLDKTYYQTVKGMVGAMEILEPGGNLIIASEISEGMGSEEFVEAQHRLVELGPDAFLASILKKSHAAIDEWQTQMQLKPMAIGNIYLYSTGLEAGSDHPTGVHHIDSTTDSIEAAVLRSIEQTGDSAVAVVPEGPYIVPFSHRGDRQTAAA